MTPIDHVCAALGIAKPGMTRCPAHEDGTASLSVGVGDDGKVLLKCHAGCAVEAIVAALGLTMRELFNGDDDRNDTRARRRMWFPPAPVADAKIAARIATVWSETVDDNGTIARYLTSRGLSGTVPPALRLHPALPYFNEDGVVIGTFPAIVAEVRRLDGTTIALHRTYLNSNGTRKADVPTPRKLTSAIYNGATKGAAIVLTEPLDGRVALTEGIETGLAVMQAQAAGVPTWACVSAGGLEAVALPDEVRVIEIWADHDASGTGMKAAVATAARLTAESDGPRTIYILLPARVGSDWLDVLIHDGAEALRAARGAAVPWSPGEGSSTGNGPRDAGGGDGPQSDDAAGVGAHDDDAGVLAAARALVRDLPTTAKADPGAAFAPAVLAALALIHRCDPPLWARLAAKLKGVVNLTDVKRQLDALDGARHAAEEAARRTAAADRMTALGPRPRLTGAQSFVGGTLVYTLRVDGQVLVATAPGHVWRREEAEERYQLGKVPDCEARISRGALDCFAKGAPAPDGRQLVQDIRDLLARHIAWPTRYDPLVVALWIVGTYLFQCFLFFPYLFLNSAARRCAKTLVLDCLSELAWNATPPQTTPSPATLYRDVDANSATLVLDEVEALGDGDKEKRADLLAVLNIGFKRGACVTRMDKSPAGAFTPRRYSTFSPKALASIKRVADTIRDRSIVICMERKPPHVKLERFNVRKLGGMLQDLRDRLHLFALANAADVAELYDAAEHFLIPAGVDDRARDILEPLFAVAAAIDLGTGTATLTPSLVEATTAIGGARDADEQEDETIVLAVRALLDLVTAKANGSGAVVVTSKEAVDLFQATGLGWVEKPTQASNLLRRLGFRSGSHWRDGKTIRAYAIDREKVGDLAARYPSDPPAEEPAHA